MMPSKRSGSRANPYHGLQTSILEIFTKAVVPHAIIAPLLVKRFAAAGIRLKPAERRAIADACKRIEAGESVEILRDLPIKRQKATIVDVGITEDELDRALSKLEPITADATTKIIEQLLPTYSKQYRAWAREAASASHLSVTHFRSRMQRTWKKPFRLLSEFVLCCTTAGEDFMAELAFDKPSAKLAPRFAALFLLHARACLVAREIEGLLHTGFADAAIARWRTLHEIAVVVFFLAENDDAVATRYLQHDRIENEKAANLYQQYAGRLKLRRFTAKAMAQIGQTSAQLRLLHGEEFGNEYGWAAAAFGGKPPRFSQIEEKVSMQHLRPYYKLASQQTHASTKGAIYRLGLNENTVHGRDLFLVGSTNSGFSDSAQLMSLSLLQITTCLLSENSVIDRVVITRLLSEMQSELPSCFFEVQEKIDRQERDLRMRERRRAGRSPSSKRPKKGRT